MRRTPILLTLLLLAAPAAAQSCEYDYDCNDPRVEQRPTGGYLGGGLALARTQGEFSDYVDGGIGFDAAYVHRLDREGWLALHVDGGMLIYGHETQRVPLSNTIGGRVQVDVNTTNSIDNPDGTISVFPVRSDTDLLTFRVGVSVGVTR